MELLTLPNALLLCHLIWNNYNYRNGCNFYLIDEPPIDVYVIF